MTASADRADCEVRALRIVPELLEAAYPTTKVQDEPEPDLVGIMDVHLPVLLHYDTSSHVQHLVPCGDRTLKDVYTDARLDIPKLGRRLGRWLARLHAVAPVPDAFADNAVGRRVCGAGCRNAPRVLDAAGLGSEPFRQIVARYEDVLDEEKGEEGASALCHGDFWPGNVLLSAGTEGSTLDVKSQGIEADAKADKLRDPCTTSAKAASSHTPRLTVLDWEMSRRGSGATDVGQFSAEAWLLDTFRGGRSLLQAFLSGYAEEAGRRMTPEFAKRAGVHMGVHLGYWPSMIVPGWADEAGSRGILEFGRDLVTNADRRGVEWMKGSVLGELVTSL